jgi:mRNA interferase RelE/StbE
VSSQYEPILTGPALRDLGSLPPKVVDPLLAFVYGGLAANPRRRGKPLGGELTGRWSARRGSYRVIYRLDDDSRSMYVLRVGHRGGVYRRP